MANGPGDFPDTVRRVHLLRGSLEFRRRGSNCHLLPEGEVCFKTRKRKKKRRFLEAFLEGGGGGRTSTTPRRGGYDLKKKLEAFLETGGTNEHSAEAGWVWYQGF